MRKLFIGVASIFLFFAVASMASAYVAASSNYQLEKDSLNFGGNDSSASTNYLNIGTLGEIVSGLSAGSNYNASTGYRYMNPEATASVPPTPVSGCTDPTANNYNSAATVDDGTCDYDHDGGTLGCTDPQASNYNSAATVDNGSCTYPPGAIRGCTDSRAYNYNPAATVDDGSCSYVRDGILGCLDPRATNYNPRATEDDGSCLYPPGRGLYGCTDPQASNYNPRATVDDGSCIYGPFSTTTEEIITQPSTDWDFRFIQPKERVKTFDNKMRVWILGEKDLTILFNYNLAPQTLKTIGVTLTDPIDKTKTFSFLMHQSKDGTAYEATIAPLIRPGTYPIDVYIISYDNQAVKHVKGNLIVSGTGILPILALLGLLPLLFNLLVALFQLFSYFFGRRKTDNPWGTVYDSVTKRPLDPVYLTVSHGNLPTLVDSAVPTEKEIPTAITDIDGRFSFFLPAGTYTIKANKTHYRFPSEQLQGKNSDELYDHLYFGNEFTTNGESVINLNIPMDPIDFDWNEFAKTKKNFFGFYSRRELWLKRLYKLVFVAGFILSAYVLLVSPSVWNIIVVALYLGLSIYNYFWSTRHKPLQIIKAETGESLPFAIVRVFLPDLNQQIKYAVADELGRFYLLVRPGVYYYTVEAKQLDGSYLKVSQSDPVNLPKGVLTANIYVK